jgi:hypothetical protein
MKKNTDLTGRFTVISSRGNVCLMVLYEYDENAIMAEPIKSNKAAELLRSFQVMEKIDIQRTQTKIYEIGQ